MELENRRENVFSHLNKLGINYDLYNHEALPTIDIALGYWKDVDATHCKNLFFRNHKGNKHYLVILECHKEMNIRALELQLKQGKLSFASPERLMKYLGTTPGSVSLFSLVNDANCMVKLYLDKDLLDAEYLTFHPNDNTASLRISKSDMLLFLDDWGGEWETI